MRILVLYFAIGYKEKIKKEILQISVVGETLTPEHNVDDSGRDFSHKVFLPRGVFSSSQIQGVRENRHVLLQCSGTKKREGGRHRYEFNRLEFAHNRECMLMGLLLFFNYTKDCFSSKGKKIEL